jgi:hypothetical protein
LKGFHFVACVQKGLIFDHAGAVAAAKASFDKGGVWKELLSFSLVNLVELAELHWVREYVVEVSLLLLMGQGAGLEVDCDNDKHVLLRRWVVEQCAEVEPGHCLSGCFA